MARRTDLLLFFVLAVIWGSAFPAIKAGLAYLDPVLFAAVRYDIAGAVLLAVGAVRGAARMPRGRPAWTIVLVSAALNIVAYHALLFWGQQFTSSGVAAVIVGLNPVLTLVLSRLLLPGEGVSILGFGGLVAGLLGVSVLMGLKPGELLDARGVGELAVVGAIASWALGSVLVRRSNHGLSVLTFTTWQMLIGALGLHVLSAVAEPGAEIVVNRVTVASMLYLSLLASALGFLIYFALLPRIGPIRINLVSYCAPVAATIVGMALLHEPFELRAALAFLLIMAGFTIVVRDRREPKPAAASS